jgi:hypothetical protein
LTSASRSFFSRSPFSSWYWLVIVVEICAIKVLRSNPWTLAWGCWFVALLGAGRLGGA